MLHCASNSNHYLHLCDDEPPQRLERRCAMMGKRWQEIFDDINKMNKQN